MNLKNISDENSTPNVRYFIYRRWTIACPRQREQ